MIKQEQMGNAGLWEALAREGQAGGGSNGGF